MIKAPKLKAGDEIRIIAPSRSLALISPEVRKLAEERLSQLGFKVSFGKNVEEVDTFLSSSVESRVSDLHEAFADKNVKAILTVIGGFNSNQLLKYIDWDLIKNNPKPVCGYSDITILANAIFAKTGLVTYYGPHYSSFGEKLNFDYTLEYFKKVLMSEESFELRPSETWSNDTWYLDQDHRDLIKNEGWWAIHPGQAEGLILGGNLNTFNLLQGTEYFPNFISDTILFIEEDGGTGGAGDVEFDRNLQSIIHLPNFDKVKAIIIGRFEKVSKMTEEKLKLIIESKKELGNLPIIANVDFGHTTPMATFPIGGRAKIDTEKMVLEVSG